MLLNNPLKRALHRKFSGEILCAVCLRAFLVIKRGCSTNLWFVPMKFEVEKLVLIAIAVFIESI